MKSFAKVTLLFALIITGRYLQPVAPSTVATRPAPSTQALPLALARYTMAPVPVQNLPAQSPATPGYYL